MRLTIKAFGTAFQYRAGSIARPIAQLATNLFQGVRVAFSAILSGPRASREAILLSYAPTHGLLAFQGDWLFQSSRN